jgi:cellulose synthase/poly-beta-1,6-N-acetylglucosamine synthase-like glycosyltransferase
MVEAVFWLSLVTLVYAYIGYPVLLALLAALRARPIDKKEITPRVSMVIPVYNEARVIRQKLENCLAQDYPPEKLQIIVVSDASTDTTRDIVSAYADRGVVYLELPQRQGKEAGQNLAVSNAEGEVIVFSDASIMLDKQALRQMVANFHDETVGCVSGEDRSVSSNQALPEESEGLYVRYEMLIRRLETRLASIVGASGCFYGVRRHLCAPLPVSIPRDFVAPLEVQERGFRSISEPQAIAFVKTVANPRDEFPRRIRTATRGLGGLLYKRHLLGLHRYGLFALMLFSHKLLRFLAPVFMIVLLISNALLFTRPLYQGFAILQGIFYGLACVGYCLAARNRASKLFSFPFYFVMVNLAILIAWYRLLSGKQYATWSPSKRRI